MIFVYLFLLLLTDLRFNLFVKNKQKQASNCLDSLNLLYYFFISKNLFMITCQNLFYVYVWSLVRPFLFVKIFWTGQNNFNSRFLRLLYDVATFPRCGGFSTMWRIFYGVVTFLRCGDFSTMWKIFYDVENFLRCGEFSTIWRLFYDVENFLRGGEIFTIWRIFYDVENFLRCREISTMWRIFNDMENSLRCWKFSTV